MSANPEQSMNARGGVLNPICPFQYLAYIYEGLWSGTGLCLNNICLRHRFPVRSSYRRNITLCLREAVFFEQEAYYIKGCMIPISQIVNAFNNMSCMVW